MPFTMDACKLTSLSMWLDPSHGLKGELRYETTYCNVSIRSATIWNLVDHNSPNRDGDFSRRRHPHVTDSQSLFAMPDGHNVNSF